MQKVICNSERKNSKLIEVGNVYYIDLTSIFSDIDGEWFVEVYKDKDGDEYIGCFRLNHFTTT